MELVPRPKLPLLDSSLVNMPHANERQSFYRRNGRLTSGTEEPLHQIPTSVFHINTSRKDSAILAVFADFQLSGERRQMNLDGLQSLSRREGRWLLTKKVVPDGLRLAINQNWIRKRRRIPDTHPPQHQTTKFQLTTAYSTPRLDETVLSPQDPLRRGYNCSLAARTRHSSSTRRNRRLT